MDPYDLILGMFALAVTAVMLVAGRALSLDKARETQDPHISGPNSNIIDPVAFSCLHATGGSAAAEFFGEKLRPPPDWDPFWCESTGIAQSQHEDPKPAEWEGAERPPCRDDTICTF